VALPALPHLRMFVGVLVCRNSHQGPAEQGANSAPQSDGPHVDNHLMSWILCEQGERQQKEAQKKGFSTKSLHKTQNLLMVRMHA
jgi:hypothetical protein